MKHDRNIALQEATHLFWEKGFHATSMRNLQEALDMRPGSIYASFGSKDQLFLASMDHYAEMSHAMLRSFREELESPMKAIEAFMRHVVLGVHSAPSDMCMLVKSISELTDEQPELLAHAKGLLREMEDAMTAIFEQAKSEGELDDSADPRRLARMLQMQLMGLRAYAKASQPECKIEPLIDDVIQSLKTSRKVADQ